MRTIGNWTQVTIGGAALLSLAIVATLLGAGASQAQGSSRTFPETGKTVAGRFLDYWNANGGLAQQGYPISAEMQEKSDTDGKTYSVQYFERAVFEKHPENSVPNDVLLSLLGNFLYKQKYAGNAQGQTPNRDAGSRLFPETGKRVGGVFLDYWQSHGGLAQQGYPISDEFSERSALDGKTYKVQYFERAVFEYHPENNTPYNVLLSQLGTFRYGAKYTASAPTATTRPVAAATATKVSGTQEAHVTLVEWAINPSPLNVSAGKVRITVANNGNSMHNLTILNDSGVVGATPSFRPSDGPKVLEVDLPPGTYQMICSLPGHAQAGQRGNIVVK